jgi:hypothetical protein
MHHVLMLDEKPCGCGSQDENSAEYQRVCDYCDTHWVDTHCPHDIFQNPCPECDVVPLAQLVDGDRLVSTSSESRRPKP